MKIKTFAILLCGVAMVAGAVSSGGLIYSYYKTKEADAASQYSWTAVNGDQNKFGNTSGTATLGGITWNYTQGSTTYKGWQNGYIQLGSGSGSNGAFTLTADLPESYGSAISQISVISSSYKASKSLSIKVGDEVLVNNIATAEWTDYSTITTGPINPAKSGTIEISWTAGSRALYLKQITIVGADLPTNFVTDLSVDPTSISYKTTDTLQASDFDVSVTKNGAAGTSSDYTAKIGTGEGDSFVGRDIVWGTTQPTIDDETIQFKSKHPQSAENLTYLTADVLIDVTPVVLTSIEISGDLTKTNYITTDSWDPTGLVVTGTFDDSTTGDVTGGVVWSYDPATPNITSITSVEITATIGVLSDQVTKTVTVSEAPAPTSFTLITSVSELTQGMKIVIAGTNNGTTYAMSATQNTNNRNAIESGVYVDTIFPGEGSAEFTLGITTKESATVYTFHDDNGFIYAASSSNNYLRSQETLDDNGKWAITFTSGVPSIVAQGTYTRNIMRFNYNNGSPLFSAYASGQTAVALYGLPASASSDAEVVDAFVSDYMHPEIDYSNSSNTGMCLGPTGYYALAKAAFNSLTNSQRTLFVNDEAYALPLGRLITWAAANGEELDLTEYLLIGARSINPLQMFNQTNYGVLIALSSLTSFLGLFGLLYLTKKKQKE
ncbi:MAG: hypothetical protein PHU89_03490 [Bacilli bacterium]|nr:hypothetical protein [Bacilli bacterium]